MRVLIVDARGAEGDLLREMVSTLGHSVYHVESGLHALTMVERHAPEAWLIADNLEDIELRELCASLRLDTAASEALVLAYVASGSRLTARPEAADGLLRTEDDLLTLTYLADQKMQEWVELQRARRWSAGLHSLRSFERDANALVGSFELVSFVELVQMITLAGRRAVLEILLELGAARLYFKRGEVLHAEYGSIEGEPAAQAIHDAVDRSPATRFRITRVAPEELEELPVSVGMHGQQLLLQLSVKRDRDDQDRESADLGREPSWLTEPDDADGGSADGASADEASGEEAAADELPGEGEGVAR